MADVIQRPATAAQEIEAPAVVFVNRPFIPRNCVDTRHFVFAQQVNDPDFENPILWVNHLTVAHDRRLMEHYPDRQGLVMLWRQPGCQPVFVSLQDTDQWYIRDGNTGGSTPIPSPEEMQ